MSFISKHPFIVSVILGIIFAPILIAIMVVANDQAMQTESQFDADVEISLTGGSTINCQIDEITVNWEKQIVLINTNERALVYPFYQIKCMNFPEESLNNPYQLMPAGF